MRPHPFFLMKRYLPAILLCCLLASCGDAKKTGGADDILLHGSKAPAYFLQPGELKYYTPTTSDVVAAKPHITAFLTQSIAYSPEQYRGQYFGVVADGKKRMFCNFYDRSHDLSHGWANQMFSAIGLAEGEWFYVHYDIDTQQCFELTVP